MWQVILANNIIFYNARILSDLVESKEKAGLTDELEHIKRISPVAWQHVNIYGNYIFKTSVGLDPIAEIVSRLRFSNENYNDDDMAG